MMDLAEELSRQLNADVSMDPDGPSFAAICKSADIKFDFSPNAPIKERLIDLLNVMS